MTECVAAVCNSGLHVVITNRIAKWAVRIPLIPVRLMLGLPPVYGLTIKSRVLQLARRAGLYRGTIDFRALARPVQLGVSGAPMGQRTV